MSRVLPRADQLVQLLADTPLWVLLPLVACMLLPLGRPLPPEPLEVPQQREKAPGLFVVLLLRVYLPATVVPLVVGLVVVGPHRRCGRPVLLVVKRPLWTAVALWPL